MSSVYLLVIQIFLADGQTDRRVNQVVQDVLADKKYNGHWMLLQKTMHLLLYFSLSTMSIGIEYTYSLKVSL